ncbi:phage protease [Phaeobacter sp. HF9A]|uniref:phage protease n=1 Tax=Phaeobacter sp. HF9A TaxID=2721561 RepID=UPI0020CA816D|nr:phage protease [Phaeobacter sp. HF9A]
MAAQDLPTVESDGQVPEWIHLVPAGRIETFDGRGPYEISDPQAVIEASFAARGEIEIDVNHATFLAAKQGGEAPARGWITEMQSREDGIWGKVRWTKEGARLVAEKAYRRISPVLGLPHEDSNQVISIRNASLVNRQNLRGLTALNFEKEDGSMSFLEQLAARMDLGADATEDQVIAAINKLKAGGDGAIAAQSQLSEVATILGVPEGGDVVAAAKEKSAGSPTVAALQSTVTELAASMAAQSEELKALKGGRSKEKAEAFLASEIQRGRFLPPSFREKAVALHQEDPEGTEKMVAGFPMLNEPDLSQLRPPSEDGKISMNTEELQAAKLLGLSAEDYQSVLEAERKAQGGL